MSNISDILHGLGLPPLPSHSPDTIAALLWARELLQKHITTTYAVQDSKGIEELKSIKIGGVDQWLHIRGRNLNNPVLLYIHGGPGSPMIGYMDAIQRPWEDFFTVVHWDQRQTGKSYYPADDENNPLHMEHLIDDAIEVIQYLRQQFKQEKIFVLGHSIGSVLGMNAVKRHPEWLHAFIGLGQVVNMTLGERTLYQRLLHHAHNNNDTELVEKLKVIIPLMDVESPEREKTFVDNCVFVRKHLANMARETVMRHLAYEDVVNMVNFDCLISPHLSAVDLSNTLIGDKMAVFRQPYSNLTKDFLDINLPQQLGNKFNVPIFFFSGRHDFQAPVTISDQWFSEIEAPYKELIHFEEAGHLIVNEEPGKVLMALVNKVLPFARANAGDINKGPVTAHG